MENIHFQQPDVTIGFDVNYHAVCVFHHSPQTSSEFRLAIAKGIECFKAHFVKGTSISWLVDTSKQGALSIDDLTWCSRLIKKECNHLQKMAVVMPRSIFGSNAVNNFLELNTRKGINNKAFTSVDKAKSWLLDQ